MENNTDRILSVQSHVAFGYVGGKAAVFPLQCLGYDVDVVHTVSFSNHTGYGRFGGWKATRDDLSTVFGHMRQNGLLKSGRLLTGYIPSAEALQSVKDVAIHLREQNSGLIYLLDPVMGDAGRLYVAADVIPMYKSMLPLSTIITPNWFEVETLTGVRLTSASSLRQALTILHHEHHVPNVVISSMPYGAAGWSGFPASARPSSIPDVNELVTCLCSTSAGASEHAKDSKSTDLVIHVRAVKLIPGYFSGVGDLFSAMVLAHFQPSFSSAPPDGNSTSTPPSAHLFDQSIAGQTPLSLAVSSALAKTHAVLTQTQTHFTSLPADEQTSTDEELDAADPERKVTRMRARELRLVQSQDIIRDPALGREGMILWEGFDSME